MNLIDEFCKLNAEKYGVSEEKMKETIRYPFKYFKRQMAKKELPTIRIKYFGVIKVLPKRLTGMLTILNKRRSLNKISNEEYHNLTDMIKNRIKNGKAKTSKRKS